MLSLEEIKKGLEISKKDIRLMKEKLNNPDNQNRSTIISIESDYVFQCQSCRECDMGRDSFYSITKKLIGAEFNYEIDNSIIKTSEGISKLDDLGFEPGFSSTLNYVPDVGYVCDHCMVSIFNG